MTILGFLSWRPQTGYDLKKLIAESEILPWSGNNNQIYKTLLELHRAGLVTVEVEQQEALPARKVYSITPVGQTELRQWVRSEPEAPGFRNGFLIQLLWADQLSAAELTDLLDRYEREVNLEVVRVQEILRRRRGSPDRTSRETYLWSMLHENRIRGYQAELDWLRDLREGLRGAS